MSYRLERLRAELIVDRPALRRLICCQVLPREYSSNDSHGTGYRLWKLEQRLNERRHEYVTRAFKTPRQLKQCADWLVRTDEYLDRHKLNAL